MKKKLIPFLIAGMLGTSFSTTVYATEFEIEDSYSDENVVADSEAAPETIATECEETDMETQIIEIEETTCTEICHINISYDKEFYIIENLCPTEETDTMQLETSFSVEKGQELSGCLEDAASEVTDIIADVDGLSGVITQSYNIQAFVYADGTVEVKNVEVFSPEEVECDVKIFEEEEIDTELDDEESDTELENEEDQDTEIDKKEELETKPESNSVITEIDNEESLEETSEENSSAEITPADISPAEPENTSNDTKKETQSQTSECITIEAEPKTATGTEDNLQSDCCDPLD